MRRNLDTYYSPHSVINWYLTHSLYKPLPGQIILEPCSGDGSISNYLDLNGKCTVITNDIDPTVRANTRMDAALPYAWRLFPSVDWVITNPPFYAAMDILKRAFDHVDVGVAFYVRKSFTEPVFARREWLDDHSEYLRQIIYCPRLSFTGDGKRDTQSCDWLIWTRDPGSCTVTWVSK